MKLSRSDIAAIKSVAGIINPKLKERERYRKEIETLTGKIETIENEIKVWEQGVRNITGLGIEEIVEKEIVNGKTKFKIREGIFEESDNTHQTSIFENNETESNQ